MYKKTIKRGERNFDYYIYVDYSENLIGYIIIERNKIEELIPKISRFRHYRQSKNRKIYLKHINDTIKKEKIYSSLLEFKIKEMHESIEVYANVLDVPLTQIWNQSVNRIKGSLNPQYLINKFTLRVNTLTKH